MNSLFIFMLICAALLGWGAAYLLDWYVGDDEDRGW